MHRSPPAYHTPPLGPPARWGSRLLGQADRLISALGLASDEVQAPLAAELTRRSLWGALPRRPAPHPSGPPQLALSFDLDYQADTDALAALVDLAGRVGVRMTLFCIGKLVEADPAPYRRAADAGHEIANHTHTHPDNPVLNPNREFWDLSVEEMEREISRAQDVLERETGKRPVGFRTPHFKDARRMMQAVERFPELRYVSTALASKAPLAVPYFPTTAPVAGDLSLHFSSSDPRRNSERLMIPLTPCPGVRWSPFSSYVSIRRPADPARGAGLHSLEEFSALWNKMLRKARPSGFASVYFDPMDVMRDAETTAVFEAMLRRARADGWRLTTLDDVEQMWRPFLRAEASATMSSSY